MKISFQKAFFGLAFFVLCFVILIYAKSILVPIAVSLLIAFILYPLIKKFEGWGMGKAFSSFLGLLSMYIVVGVTVYLFSKQIVDLADNLTDLGNKLTRIFTEAIVFINKNFSFVEDLNKQDLYTEGRKFITSKGAQLAGSTFNETTSLLTGLITVTIYTFLILLYRSGLSKAFSMFAVEDKRKQLLETYRKIQKVGQQYVTGMLILISILGLTNSIGLWIIGIDSPFLFGFFAAFLSIIPYLGTTLGATIPVLYAFFTHDQLWVPIAVAVMFWFIQLVESNFLSPKIVGSSLNVNAFAAILSLFIGAAVWGVAGMILFLPFASMLKVACEQYESLKPIALLIGEEAYVDGKQQKQGWSLSDKITNWFSSLKQK